MHVLLAMLNPRKKPEFSNYICIKAGVQQIIPAPTDFSMNGSATVSLNYRITSCKPCSVGEPALSFFLLPKRGGTVTNT